MSITSKIDLKYQHHIPIMEITNLQLPVVSIYHGNGPITLMLMLN